MGTGTGSGPLPSRRVALGLTILAAIIWGTSFPANDLGLRVLHPATFAFSRFLLAGVSATLLASLTGRMDWSLGREPWIWGLGLLNAVGFLLQYVGQTTTTPAHAALFVNLDVLWVALVSVVLFREPLTPRRGSAVALALAGGVLLQADGGSLAEVLASGSLRGDLAALAGGIAWGGYILWNKHAVDHDVAVVPLVTWTFLTTSAWLAPVALWSGSAVPATPLAWGSILYLGLACTLLAYGVWTWGLRSVTATASAIILLLEIAVAAGISMVLGWESFTLVSGLGGVLVMVAILLASLPRRVAASGKDRA